MCCAENRPGLRSESYPLTPGQCKKKTADCRLRTRGKIQTESGWNADCRLRVKRRLGAKWRKRTADFLNINIALLLLQIASWYQLHTLGTPRFLVEVHALHILQKFQWTSEQLKSEYLDLQYFHRSSSKFPAEHLSLDGRFFHFRTTFKG